MALQIEQQTRDIGVVRTPIAGERTRVVVRPGDAFRFIDDAGQPLVRAPRLRVRRIDNNLIIDGLPDGREVELNNFFGACRPGAECKVSLEGIGFPGSAPITEETLPSAALQDGSFLLYVDNSDVKTASGVLAATQVAQATGPSWLAIGGAALGVAGAAAAAGGGGGGGSGGPVADTTPPPAPLITSGAAIKRGSAIITGEGEPGARITLRVDVNGNGSFSDSGDLTFVTTVGADGRWQVDLNSTPQAGTPPAGGLGDGSYGIIAVANDTAQNASPATRSTVALDGVAPAPAVISTVATDDVVNGAEGAAGVTIAGTGEAGTAVRVGWGNTSKTGTVAADGRFTFVFSTAELPGQGSGTVNVELADSAGNTSTATRAVSVDTVAPVAPTVTSGAFTDAAQPTIRGAAEAGSTVRISLDLANNGSVDAVYTVTAAANGTWTLPLASATPTSGSIGSGLVDLQANAFTVVATDAAGNASTTTSASLTRDSRIPPAPVISTVAGDDIVNATERPGGITVSGTIAGAFSGRPVDVTVNGITQSATVTGTSWTTTFTAAQLPSANGTFTIQATTSNVAGLTSAIGTRDVLLDTTPPSAPAAPTVPEAAGGGLNATEASDGTTVNVSLAGTGAAAGDTVIVSWGGTQVSRVLTGGDISGGTAAVSISSTTISSVGDSASLAVSASIRDAGGNTGSASPSTTIVVDTTAPTQALSSITVTDNVAPVTGSVANGATINDANPSLSIVLGSALLAGETLTLVRGATTVASITTGTTLNFTESTALADASYVYSAVLTDAAGNSRTLDLNGAGTAGTGYTIVVDTTPPTTPASAPDLTTASDNGTLSNDNVTTIQTPVFTIGAAPTGATAAVLLVDGVAVNSTWNSGANTLAVVDALSYSATARSFTYAWTDAAGNTSTASPALSVTVNTSSTPPAAPSVAPNLTAATDSGVSNTDNITNSTVPAFTIGTVPGGTAAVRLYVGGSQVAATWDGGTTLTATAAPPNSNSPAAVTYRYVDAYGNESSDSPALNVTFDRTAPTLGSLSISFDVFDDGGTVPTGDDVAFTHNVRNPALTDTTPTVTLAVGNLLANDRITLVSDSTTLATITADGNYTYSDGPFTASSTHSYSATLSDAAGNTPLLLDLAPSAAGTTYLLLLGP